MKKRILALCLSFVFLCPHLGVCALSTSASSAILVDGGSGRILYAQNENEQRLIASITKLMTALLVAEKVKNLQETVEVPYEATLAEGSSMYLKAGETVTVEALLYGLLLASGNDAAVALAVYCGGSVEGFVEQMNHKALALGMADSHFVNPNGLNDDAHYSTAHDMALLARACMENPTVAQIVATKSATFGARTFTNHNKLLWRYEGCVGMKTGYTERAGRTLVSAACRDGQTLISVTLNDPNDWQDHANLFDYGFENYPQFQLARTGKLMGRLPVSGSLVPAVTVAMTEDFYYPLCSSEQVTVKLALPQRLESPVMRGQVVGEVQFYLDGVQLGAVPLAAISSVSCDLVPNNSFARSILEKLWGSRS